MSSKALQEDAWLMRVSSECPQSIREEVETSKLEGSKLCAVAAAGHDKSLTARDYIGLSVASASASSSTVSNGVPNLMCSDSTKRADGREEVSVDGDTELRLGIGPYNGDVSTNQHGGCLGQSVPQQHVLPLTHMLKQADGSNSSQYWCQGGVSSASSVEFHQSFWPWGPGVAPGRFMIPVPKISMVPAKRPYLEVMGKNGSKPSACTLTTNSSTLVEPATLERGASHDRRPSTASPAPIVASSSSSSQGGGFYVWSASTTTPPNVVRAATWQHGDCNQEGMVGAPPVKNSCPTRALPQPPLFKPCPAPQAGQMPPMVSDQSVAAHVAVLEERAARTLEANKENASTNKSPMVGWPPVRSFRKNTLQSAAGLGMSKGTGAATDVHDHEGASKVNEPPVDQQLKGSAKLDALFVKAKLDGVRICRKVDLASYSSYDSLKAALQDMFQGFVCNDNSNFDLLHSDNYVLTHEDKDGDTMLVGDVPWHMFITTVKSLRIMKAVDAVGLGGKVSTKMEGQRLTQS